MAISSTSRAEMRGFAKNTKAHQDPELAHGGPHRFHRVGDAIGDAIGEVGPRQMG